MGSFLIVLFSSMFTKLKSLDFQKTCYFYQGHYYYGQFRYGIF
jgi:hypothetical protein